MSITEHTIKTERHTTFYLAAWRQDPKTDHSSYSFTAGRVINLAGAGKADRGECGFSEMAGDRGAWRVAAAEMRRA